MRKSVNVVVIVLVACAISVILSSLSGCVSAPSAHRWLEDTRNSTKHDEVEMENDRDVKTQENDGGTVGTLSVPTYTEEPSDKPSKKHEHGKIFSFQFKGSTAMSSVRPYCESKEHFNLGYSLFRGTPSDTSYLDVIREHSDSDEIVWGEYYTITATVSTGDHDFNRVRIDCKVQSDNVIVGFSVEFREEFGKDMKDVEVGDIVTFRGRFYDEGCGFTDCELIDHEPQNVV